MSVDNLCCIIVDNVIPSCFIKSIHMTDEQLIKFSKYVAKQTKKVMLDKVIEVDIYRNRLKVKVSGIIPPKDKWGNYRVNVKVIECKGEVAMRGEDGFMLRDDLGNIRYEYLPRTLRRSEVNNVNYRVRDKVKYACGDMMDFFGIETWRIKVEKVAHS